MLSAALTAALSAGLLLAGPPPRAEPATTPTTTPAASTFTPVSPTRVLDTRGGPGPVGAGQVVTVDLAARVPATATAVVLTVTGGGTDGTHARHGLPHRSGDAGRLEPQPGGR